MKIIKAIWLFVTIVAFLEIISPLEYTYDASRLFVYVFVIAGFLFLALMHKKNLHIIYTLTFGSFVSVLTVSLIINFFTHTIGFGSGFKTQQILYRHVDYPNTRIEYLMEDIGAFGYNRKNQKVIRITPLLEWRVDTDINNLDPSTWKEVNEYVNELGLKGG